MADTRTVSVIVVVMARDLLPPGAALFGGMVAVLAFGSLPPTRPSWASQIPPP